MLELLNQLLGWLVRLIDHVGNWIIWRGIREQANAPDNFFQVTSLSEGII
jgi:hypothetical protein